MPADLERLIDGVLNPPLPWPDLLREFMTNIVHSDENWTRRNRRITHVVLPGNLSEAMGEIVLIGDTSGSVGARS
jgi:predicted metal-dependent peptidase